MSNQQTSSMPPELTALGKLLRDRKEIVPLVSKFIQARFGAANLAAFNANEIDGLTDKDKVDLYKKWADWVREDKTSNFEAEPEPVEEESESEPEPAKEEKEEPEPAKEEKEEPEPAKEPKPEPEPEPKKLEEAVGEHPAGAVEQALSVFVQREIAKATPSGDECSGQSLSEEEIRKIVREEVREALKKAFA